MFSTMVSSWRGALSVTHGSLSGIDSDATLSLDHSAQRGAGFATQHVATVTTLRGGTEWA